MSGQHITELREKRVNFLTVLPQELNDKIFEYTYTNETEDWPTDIAHVSTFDLSHCLHKSPDLQTYQPFSSEQAISKLWAHASQRAWTQSQIFNFHISRSDLKQLEKTPTELRNNIRAIALTKPYYASAKQDWAVLLEHLLRICPRLEKIKIYGIPRLPIWRLGISIQEIEEVPWVQTLLQATNLKEVFISQYASGPFLYAQPIHTKIMDYINIQLQIRQAGHLSTHEAITQAVDCTKENLLSCIPDHDEDVEKHSETKAWRYLPILAEIYPMHEQSSLKLYFDCLRQHYWMRVGEDCAHWLNFRAEKVEECVEDGTRLHAMRLLRGYRRL